LIPFDVVSVRLRVQSRDRSTPRATDVQLASRSACAIRR
jgi:hypothetical protein